MGHATYKLLRNLVKPEKPKDKTFEQLVEKLTDHYCPESVEIMERFQFYSRVRRPGEPVNEFVADVKDLQKTATSGINLR